LSSGAFEALLYEGLAERKAEQHFARVYGWISSMELLCQIPAAGAATVLFWWGGYDLVGWVSIAVCFAASLLATRLPEPSRIPVTQPAGAGLTVCAPREQHSYLSLLRSGMKEAVAHPAVRAAVVAAALVTGLDGLEEYFPLMAQQWGVPTALVPLAVIGLPLAGAVGASYGGRANRIGGATLARILFGALVLLGAMGLMALPAGLAGVAVFYGLHQMVLVVVAARLQNRIQGPARATVTSVASLATELAAIALFSAWALHGLLLVALVWLIVALALPVWLREPAH
jgi:hypothetical protein